MKTNGIVALAEFEIDRVAGGKSAVDRFWDSLMRWMDGLGGPPTGISMPSRDYAQLCEWFVPYQDSVSISETGSLSAGTLSIRLTGGDGTYTFVNVTGISG